MNRPHLAPGVQALQSQIGQQLNTNIEKQTTSGPPPQQSQATQMTAPTSPGDVEMPSRAPGRSPFKSYTDTSDSRGATNLNETTSHLTPETISALQTTADAIVNKASERILSQVKELLENSLPGPKGRNRTPVEERVPKTEGKKLINHQTLLPPPSELSEEEITMHATSLSAGPMGQNFRLHWTGANERGWNHTASYIFANEFIKCCKEGHYAVQSFPMWATKRHDIVALFRSKIPNLKTERKYILQMSSTSAEIRMQTEIKLEKMKKVKHHCACCDELLSLRIRIIKAHPELPIEWISILEEPGVDGMSSDESDTGSLLTHPTFSRIHKICRATALDKFVHIVDGYHDLPNVLGQHPHHGGNSRLIRKGNHPTLINNKPIPDYPETFYNKKYLIKFPRTLEICRASNAWSINMPIPVRDYFGVSEFQ
ncbi:hypothetical protein M422DRAFT_53308 [Sphaerobolus stellatus SS14]|uniref:Uncharacterized protein n=1 Tax=Sphaerobolus stellatus (strain SS14) TaxID=990650 RepID=A0A0C9V263_SPHS4|nr:hypothetical protein M422DRAFT_53308 [Sphaerobolus stellatus SS14]